MTDMFVAAATALTALRALWADLSAGAMLVVGVLAAHPFATVLVAAWLAGGIIGALSRSWVTGNGMSPRE
jgi:hypothetical protein